MSAPALEPEWRLTAHKPGCPALSSMEMTCPCDRELIRYLPEIPRAVAERRWGVADVARMVRSGLLERRGCGRFYLSRLFGG